MSVIAILMIPLLKVSFILEYVSLIFFSHESFSSGINSYKSLKWEAQKCHLNFLALVIPFSNNSLGVTAFRICFLLQKDCLRKSRYYFNNPV